MSCALDGRTLSALVLSALLAACSFDKGAGLGVDAGVSGPDAQVVPDAAGCVDRCDGDTRITCEGGSSSAVDCALGCVEEAGGPRCLDMVPANGVSLDLLDDVTGDLIVGDGELAEIEAATGRIEIAGELMRARGEGVIDGIRFVPGPPFNILVVAELELGAGSRLEIHSDVPTSAVILFVGGDVMIAGVIDVSGGCNDGDPECPGPGGGAGGINDTPAAGCAPGGRGATAFSDATGGGGGGFGQAGAPGGASDVQVGGLGGVPSLCPDQTLQPLAGGSGGGEGGDGGGGSRGVGGGGGGGIQITAVGSIELTAGGVWAGGAGGGAGDMRGGGGGGGAGGAILVEAPVVTIGAGAVLAANGGGGGAGNDDGDGDGSPGPLSAEPAPGGVGEDAEGGDGGSGNASPMAGQSSTFASAGGGGGAGRVRVNSRPGRLQNDGVTSPLLTSGAIGTE